MYQVPRAETLKEARLLQARRERFTQLYAQQQLPFKFFEGAEACASCGETAHWLPAWRDSNNAEQPATFVRVELIDMEGDWLCRKCFRAHWCCLPPPKANNSGTTHADTPRSQRVYDGF